jgi:diadenosine tetraphosphatase ApaH/serine/threonine PP2A family protein phosphatase
LKAIISDIHGNLEALNGVLEDILRHPVDAIYCLGDLVGYGPNPRECVDLAMRWDVVLGGNNDKAFLDQTNGSRAELEAPLPDRQTAIRRIEFLQQLKPKYQEDDYLYVHGSARNPLYEYVFPEDIHNEKKMHAIFSLVDRYSFMGHTHVPGIFTEDLQFLAPQDVKNSYRLDARKTLINVGSVGQPRDGDWRACYVLLDGDTIRFRRVEYDIGTTMRKI